MLKDKVVIVTGAASGIGKAIAEKFFSVNANVVIADLNESAAQAVANSLDATGKRAMSVAMDVTDEAQVALAIEEVYQQYGYIDVLISNAGIQLVDSLDQLKYSDWKKMMAIHLDGAFLTTRACLKKMYASNRGGSIIYIGSCHSREASPLKAPYVTAKHGLLGLSKVVAIEGAKYGVRSNVICPGFVFTPLVEKQIPEQAKRLNISEEEVIKKIMLKHTVDGEFTTLEDVANAALFFAAFPSCALTGQSLGVSNGWAMR